MFTRAAGFPSLTYKVLQGSNANDLLICIPSDAIVLQRFFCIPRGCWMRLVYELNSSSFERFNLRCFLD